MTTQDKLYPLLHPGDVFLTWGEADSLPLAIAYMGIREYQHRLFGYGAEINPTHATMYFDPDHVFSCTTPKVCWETLEHQLEREWAVYRYCKDTDTYLQTLVDKEGHFLSVADIIAMKSIASSMIGLEYDYGDLLDFMVNELLGYTNVKPIEVFGVRDKFVCSTAVRSIFERLRKEQEKDGKEFVMPRLFNMLNPSHWTQEQIDRFVRVYVEETTPAHFANSRWFDWCFYEVMNSQRMRTGI